MKAVDKRKLANMPESHNIANREKASVLVGELFDLLILSSQSNITTDIQLVGREPFLGLLADVNQILCDVAHTILFHGVRLATAVHDSITVSCWNCLKVPLFMRTIT